MTSQASAFAFAAEPQFSPRTEQLFESETIGILNQLRMIAIRCRCAARTDLFHACAVLSVDRSTSKGAHAEILIRCLEQALGKRPVFHRPGSAEISFDEAWLSRAIEAIRKGDEDSFRFVLCARVPHLTRRNLAFLVRGVTDAFSQD